MALHPNRYNRTSEAYDFTLFEGKELEDKYTVHRKSKELAVGTGTGKRTVCKHNLKLMYTVSKNSAAEQERFGL